MSKSQLKTDWVCIATAGATVDGRTISEQDLFDMAETYDPECYQAFIWWEHYRFFSNLGEVLSLKVEKLDNTVKLFAELRPTAELVQLNQNGQKVFTSIEIMPNFAKTDKAYLGGLAVTDSPASLGTTKLNFSALGIKDQDLIIGNQEPFTFNVITESEKESFFNAIVDTVKKFTHKNSEQKTPIETNFSNNNNNKEENPSMNEKQFNQLLEAVTGLSQKIDEKFSQQAISEITEQTQQEEPVKTVTAEEFSALQEKFNALEQQFKVLEKTEVTPIPNGQGGHQSNFNMAV